MYVETVAKINELVTSDFAAAREYSTTFEEHRKVYNFGKEWDLAAYTSKKKYASTLRERKRGRERVDKWRGGKSTLLRRT